MSMDEFNSKDFNVLHRALLAGACVLAVTACGSDGGGGGGEEPVQNNAPVAVAEVEGDSHLELRPILLDASGSTDADGDALTFQWTQLEGPEVTLEGADTATPSFVPRKAEFSDLYRFLVEVSDGQASSTADIGVTVRENSYAVFYGDFEGAPGETGVYLVATDGGERVRLLDENVVDISEPVVSRDRRYVAFTADITDNGSSDETLFIFDMDSMQATAVFSTIEAFGATDGDDDGSGDGLFGDLIWSPTDNVLAFTAGANVDILQRYDLYTVEADGSNLRNLTNVPEGLNKEGWPVQRVDGYDFEWSPIGATLAFGMQFNDAERNFTRLYAVPGDGSVEAFEISDFDAETAVANAELYARGRLALNTDATVAGKSDDVTVFGKEMPDSDSNLDGIADGSVHRWAWSPAGDSLAFIGDGGPQSVKELYVVSPDGSNQRKLTHIGTTTEAGFVVTDTNGDGIADTDVEAMGWSPGSIQIAARAALATDRGNPIRREWIIDTVSGEMVEVIPDDKDLLAQTNGYFQWSPSGSYLLTMTAASSGWVGFSYELYAWDVSARSNIRLNSSSLESLDFSVLEWLPGDRFLFNSGMVGGVVPQLWISDPKTPGVTQPVINSTTVFPDWPIEVSPSGDHVAYAVPKDTPDGTVYELAVSATQPESEINRLGSQVDMYIVQWTPDSKAMAYAHFDSATGRSGLSAMSADGAQHAMDISGAFSDDPTAPGLEEYIVFGPPVEPSL